MYNHSRITINSRSITDDGKFKEDFDTEGHGNNVKVQTREEMVEARDREQTRADNAKAGDIKTFGTQEYHQDNVNLWQDRIDYLDNN